MAKLTDLTGQLAPGMWDYRVFPGLDEVIPPMTIETIAEVASDGFFASRLTMSTITGTYLEAGSHILQSGPTLDQYGVDDFVRPARILRLGDLAPDTLIDEPMLARQADRLEEGSALIIDTGWHRQWNQPGYVERCPKMVPSALGWILSQPIGLLAVDVPAIEAAWSDDDGEAKGGLLSQIFAKGCLLLAPLVNLDRVPGDEGRLFALPLPLKGTSGAPARVIFESAAP
jgi:kynurenine formamidase